VQVGCVDLLLVALGLLVCADVFVGIVRVLIKLIFKVKMLITFAASFGRRGA
jgi:hypothetical protein